MNVQSEKSSLINILQNINDISVIQKVKDFVLQEIEPIYLSKIQEEELEKRLLEHKNNPSNGIDGFEFLNNLKVKYEL